MSPDRRAAAAGTQAVAAPPEPGPATLTWPGKGVLPTKLYRSLVGPGAPFELAVEDVLGIPTEVFVRRAHTVPALLASAATRMPDSPYLVTDGPERGVLTFGQARALAAACAEVLAERYGVTRGDRVALAAPNTPEHVVAYWAVLALGAVVVELNGWWAGPELDHGLALTEPVVVFAAGRPLERLAVSAWAGEQVTRLVPLADLHRRALGRLPRTDAPAAPDAFDRVPVGEDDPAAIMFTSGTTGRPKGAVLSHRNFVHYGLTSTLAGAVIAATAGRPLRSLPPGTQRAAICASPLFHVSGAGVALVGAPSSGTKLVLPRPGRWDEAEILRLTDEHRLTSWNGVPTQLWRLLDHPRFAEFRTEQVTGIGGGGASFPPELLRVIEERMPGALVTVGYGMTETTGLGTYLGGALADRHPASVGAAAPGTQVQVRDAAGRPLPEGAIGEVHLRTAGVFLGYWRDEEATAEALTPDRWYRTGDYGRIADGVLHLESRLRDLILRGGENIYPIEIEHRLLEHPSITDACVVGVAHPVLGQEVKAVVVAAPEAPLTAQDVRDWVADALAAFKVPAHVEFRAELPYSATGKVLKRLLEDEHCS